MINFFMPWEFSILAMIVFLLATVFYWRGSFITKPSLLHKICFWSGMASFYVVTFTSFDYYSEHSFFMHSIQHSILQHQAPFLIAFGRPGVALAAGTPQALQSCFSKLVQWRPCRIAISILNKPVVAVLLFVGLIGFWLIPSVHFIAMLDVRLYRVMNWSVAIEGLMFWGLVLNNYALKPAGLTAATRMGIMLTVIPPQIVIGVILFMAPQEIYPLYSLCGRVFVMTALADQQIGGIILWIHGAMTSVIGILVVAKREWTKQPNLV